MRPNEIYGVIIDDIVTTPNEVYGVNSPNTEVIENIKTVPNTAYEVIHKH